MSGPLVRIVEGVTINMALDPWMSLEALRAYSGLSVRSLRYYLTDPLHPLPHYRMKEPRIITTKTGKTRAAGGKILVRRSDFDRWMAHYHQTPDVDKIVNEVMADLKVS
jgi:hypothetical protein